MAPSSLPPDMLLAYKRYKQDTETVAGWLAERAQKSGYKSSTPASVIKEPKLKGRARKLARDAAKEAGTFKQSRHTYIVKTAEFVDMATHIVNARPQAILSRALQETWKRTIRIRREFGQWFKSRTTTDVAVDEKHSHFASILQRALEILKPCYESGPKPSPTHNTKQKNAPMTPLEQVNNMFQNLEVEDTLSDEELKDNTKAATTAVEPTRRTHIEFDDDEAEAEFLFAIWSFLHDVMAVRVYVSSTWRLYSTGNIELMQGRAEADFESNLQRPAKYPASNYPTGALPFIIFKLHLPAEDGRDLGFDSDLAMAIIICGCEICDFLIYIPWAMAKSYVNVLRKSPPTFPSSNNNFQVQVPPFPECHTLRSHFYHAQNPSQKAQNQLREILPDFSLLCLMLRGSFIEDEILHAARHILENHNVPLWVSFALQLQVDIQRLHELNPISAFQDLHGAYQVTKQRWEEHQKWSKSLGFVPWDREGHLGSVKEEFDRWIEGSHCGKADGEEIMLRVLAGQTMAEALKEVSRVPLLERFPVTCGTMKTEMQLEWHILGLVLANSNGHVLGLCHLYNGLHIINSEAPIWPDMELLIRNQGPGKVFVGSRPTTLAEAKSRLLLSVGLSAASLAKDSRRTHFKGRNAKKREWELAPIAQNLFDRWLGTESRKVDEAAYQLQQLLFSPKYRHDLQQNLYVSVATDPRTSELTSKVIPLQTKMVQTLIKLSQAFNAEMPAFMFDYFAMERRCFQMFLQITPDVKEMMKAGWCNKHYLEARNNNPMGTTMAILDLSNNTEAVVKALTSTNRAESKARGPKMAQHIKSMMPQPKDKETQELMDNILKLTAEGRTGEVLGEIMDVSENAAATKIFDPVLVAVKGIVEQGAEDLEIRKLRKFVGGTGYGVFAFRHDSLEALYGSGTIEIWEDLCISEADINQIMLYKADNPVFYLMAIMLLQQKRVVCGEGDDSHEQSGLRSITRSECEEDFENTCRASQSHSAEEFALKMKEDWEKLGDIYGREGRRALR